jgi:tRNA (adenine-N(1)-)-methyltransferase non-catalytic subunit
LRSTAGLTLARTISIGKFGSFHSDSVIGRPYHLTYEILDKDKSQKHPRLRIVPTAELNEEAAIADFEDENENGLEPEDSDGAAGARTPDFVGKNNRLTVDEPGRQLLSMQKIEELKKEAATGSGKNIISRIMSAHSALDEKTAYSLAKYALRKAKKYMRRFTVLPMDVTALTDWILDKDASKILDLRHESLGLITSWANVHHAGNVPSASDHPQVGGGRWLVVDDTGGLVVAAVAEKMGILYQDHSEGVTKSSEQDVDATDSDAIMGNGDSTRASSSRPPNPKDRHQSAVTNTITMVHPNGQPNLAVLKYFGFVPDDSSARHPLYTNLHTLSWLQLIDPDADPTYSDEPEKVPHDVLATWKAGRRGGYFRKRRRWARTKRVTDWTRRGEFDGLIVATTMRPETVMRHLVPLVKGGGQIVAYSPTVEPLTELMDYYSRDRRAAFSAEAAARAPGEPARSVLEDPDFPLDPTMALLPSLQTVRAVEWQVLPNRTHPMMISRGGAEGYVFTTTRVLQPDVRAVARGKFSHKKRKADTVTP